MNTVEEYRKIKDIFFEQTSTDDIYDVDMFISDVWDNRPEFYDCDDFADYSQVIVMLARDDDIFEHFGYCGIVILLNELFDKIQREEA